MPHTCRSQGSRVPTLTVPPSLYFGDPRILKLSPLNLPLSPGTHLPQVVGGNTGPQPPTNPSPRSKGCPMQNPTPGGPLLLGTPPQPHTTEGPLCSWYPPQPHTRGSPLPAHPQPHTVEGLLLPSAPSLLRVSPAPGRPPPPNPTHPATPDLHLAPPPSFLSLQGSGQDGPQRGRCGGGRTLLLRAPQPAATGEATEKGSCCSPPTLPPRGRGDGTSLPRAALSPSARRAGSAALGRTRRSALAAPPLPPPSIGFVRPAAAAMVGEGTAWWRAASSASLRGQAPETVSPSSPSALVGRGQRAGRRSHLREVSALPRRSATLL